MSHMGVHLAVKDADFHALQSRGSDAARLAYVDNVIVQDYESNIGTDYDRAWPLIHSALQRSSPCSDYLERTTNGPASWAILGEEDFVATDEALVTYVSNSRTDDVRQFLRRISADDIRSNLISLIAENGCSGLSVEHANYAADWYPRVVEFYSRVAGTSRHVIFLADLI